MHKLLSLSLLVALLPLPYSYYEFLRYFVFMGLGYLIYTNWKKDNFVDGSSIIFLLVILVIFNPIEPIFLQRSTWFWVDLISAFFVYGILENGVISKSFQPHKVNMSSKPLNLIILGGILSLITLGLIQLFHTNEEPSLDSPNSVSEGVNTKKPPVDFRAAGSTDNDSINSEKQADLAMTDDKHSLCITVLGAALYNDLLEQNCGFYGGVFSKLRNLYDTGNCNDFVSKDEKKQLLHDVDTDTVKRINQMGHEYFCSGNKEPYDAIAADEKSE